VPNPVRLGGNLVIGATSTMNFQGPFDLGGTTRAIIAGAGQRAHFEGPISNGGFIKEGGDQLNLSTTNSLTTRSSSTAVPLR